MKTFFKILTFVFVVNLSFSCASTESKTGQEKQIIPDCIRIEGGTFIMGSSSEEAGRGSNETQHHVTVSTFYMSKYPITQSEWIEIMGFKDGLEKGEGPNHPVYFISWYDAIEYCNKRSLKEGLTPAYDINKTRKDPNNKSTVDKDKWTVKWNKNANGYRLPTEAEWEYACRAGTETAYNTGSDKISDNIGWYKANSGNMTQPVGRKSPNKWGLYDMHGNVWEWCWDWYGEYEVADKKNTNGPVFGDYRVVRGGSWDSGARYLHSADRLYESPNKRTYFIGFRIVRQ